jgi:uncharacterized protein DUF1186/SEC-C motif-containing protein
MAVNVQGILEGLSRQDALPVEAIHAAEADRPAMVPPFLQAIETFISATSEERAKPSPIFFIFHLLGSWREKSAYRPLARLLRCPAEDVEAVLGDANTETSSQVMAAVFDGDPQPLYDIILDPQADAFVRWGMCDALALVTLQGELPRAEAARFLAACFTELKTDPGSPVWEGWQSAIAALGLTQLRPQVKEAFERGWIDTFGQSLKDFEEDLNATLKCPDAPAWYLEQHPPLGDIVENLSTWAFSSQPDQDTEPGTYREHSSVWDDTPGQAFNPFKNVGRNDPCPCGSGKKFKKCCLDAQRDAPFRGEAA